MKPYYIEWIDIDSNREVWTELSEYDYDDAECIVKQVGFVLNQTDKYIWITECILEAQNKAGIVTRIPKSVLIKFFALDV